jgi:hypothetical protein
VVAVQLAADLGLRQIRHIKDAFWINEESE